jgi:hypothetical protein
LASFEASLNSRPTIFTKNLEILQLKKYVFKTKDIASYTPKRKLRLVEKFSAL